MDVGRLWIKMQKGGGELIPEWPKSIAMSMDSCLQLCSLCQSSVAKLSAQMQRDQVRAWWSW
eukprot:6317594-Karenia_brevis.AAC.1